MAILATAISCDPVPEPEPGPEPVNGIPSIKLDCKSFHRFADADSVAVIVTAEENASYDITIPDQARSWVSTSVQHGTQSAYVGFKIDENKSGHDRSASIEFRYGPDKTHIVHINQEAAYRHDCYEGWGITGKVIAEKRNTRPYNWYIDQAKTGPMSDNNCGPACVTMAAKWYNAFHARNAEYARSMYRASGGWWYMSDITSFLGSQNVSLRLVLLSGTDYMKQVIDEGGIAIINLDMHPLSYNSDSKQRVDKYYMTNPRWGHFLVVYGYVETESELFLEVCDPNSYDKMYMDQTLKGDGRFYRGGEVFRSLSNWTPNICVIAKP